ncbi:MAG: cell division protein FtsK [Candidatus Cloacimonetes bacterium]|nr:cell division protein FtsK [Candidatus Cloacimonadota bacterium]
MKTEGKKSFLYVFAGLALLILSVLFLFSISGDVRILNFDYEIMKNSNITFFRFIKLQFPNFNNPIGIFGVFFGYWLLYIFGKFFCFSLLSGTALIGFFMIFAKDKIKFLQKILFFIIFAFFFNFIRFSFQVNEFLVINEKIRILLVGVIPWNFFEFMVKIFDRTGTLIISIAVVITSILIIFEVENIKNFFVWFYKALYNTIRFIGSLFFKRPAVPGKKKTKTRKIKEIKILDDDRSKKSKLNIIDHVSHENEEKNPKPKIIKPKLTQDKELVTDTPREYIIPEIEDFLTSTQPTKRDRENIEANIREVSNILIQKLAEFNVDAEVMNVNIGPIITQYEIKPAAGIKVNKFHALADDLALAIKATSIRVQAPIPGRGLVGIEIPNVNRDTIFLKDILLSDEIKRMKSKLAFGLGKDISGKSMVADLATMPHLLIAGATGSGKSVCVNTIINSILFRATPDEVRFILIDPKRIELSGYEGIPHLIQEVVTNNEDALIALNWGVVEMEHRYELLQKYKVKNLNSYNEKIIKLRQKDESLEDTPLPHIIIIVDELADLMMTVGRDVERPITRLAQMARAIGVHLILATQRPSIKVITGVIKANFPSRIAFKVSTKIDSRVIIDANGAEKLLGLGDSLFLAPGKAGPDRIHGAYILPSEIHNVIDYLRTQPKPKQDITIISDEQTTLDEFNYDDELFPEAAVAVVTAGQASVSMLQRHFKIGYARAGRLIDMMEQAGIVGPHVGSKSREVMATEEDLKIYGYLPD